MLYQFGAVEDGLFELVGKFERVMRTGIYAQLAEELAETPRLENFGIEMASRFLTNFLSIEQREAIHIQKLQKNEQTSLITNVYIDFIKKKKKKKKDIYKKAWRKVDKIKYPNSLFMTELSDLLGEEQE